MFLIPFCFRHFLRTTESSLEQCTQNQFQDIVNFMMKLIIERNLLRSNFSGKGTWIVSTKMRKQLTYGLLVHSHANSSFEGSLRDHPEYTGVVHLLGGHKERIFI